jgi:hypothetical protein
MQHPCQLSERWGQTLPGSSRRKAATSVLRRYRPIFNRAYEEHQKPRFSNITLIYHRLYLNHHLFYSLDIRQASRVLYVLNLLIQRFNKEALRRKSCCLFISYGRSVARPDSDWSKTGPLPKRNLSARKCEGGRNTRSKGVTTPWDCGTNNHLINIFIYSALVHSYQE